MCLPEIRDLRLQCGKAVSGILIVLPPDGLPLYLELLDLPLDRIELLGE